MSPTAAELVALAEKAAASFMRCAEPFESLYGKVYFVHSDGSAMTANAAFRPHSTAALSATLDAASTASPEALQKALLESTVRIIDIDRETGWTKLALAERTCEGPTERVACAHLLDALLARENGRCPAPR